MSNSKAELVDIDQNKDILVPAKIYNSKTLFQKWFIHNYMSRFQQLPEILKPDERQLSRERADNIDKYFETVSKVVSYSMYGRDETSRFLEKTRKREIVMMRKVTCYILSRKLGYSLTLVGKLMQKNHATVLYHCNCVENDIKFDKEFRKMFTEIQDGLMKLGIIW